MVRRKYKDLKNAYSEQEKQEQIKRICMYMLKTFAKVCTEHELTWWVDGGTLLGAVRDGKMIPWDDDIDVVMPRKDYDKLCTLATQNVNLFGKYFFQISSTDNNFEVHAKLRNPNTCALTKREYKGCHNKGMFLDIFPLDNCPMDKDIKNDVAGFVRTFVKHSGVERNNKQSANFNTFNRILRMIHEQNANSAYVANIAFWRYDKKLTKLKKSWYASTRYIVFEDMLVPAPIGMTEILKTWYGSNWPTPTHEPNCHLAYVDPFNSYKRFNDVTYEEFEYLVK